MTNTLSEDDKVVLKAALLAMKAEGNANPLIPVDLDLNGDGLTDAYGLDAFGNLIEVHAVPIHLTDTESTGGGIETDREAVDNG